MAVARIAWVAAVVSGALATGCGGKREADPAPAPAPAPKAHPHAVLRPEFTVDGDPLAAGTAFLIKEGAATLLVTAHHLFGPAGGLDHELTWDELPRRVTAVRATSLDDPGVTIRGGSPLAVTGAVGLSEQHLGGDVAVFPIPDAGPARTLELADGPPRVGSSVTLLARVIGKTGTRHGAKVVEVGEEHIAYELDEPGELRATSGAPVVDADERVVAINVSGGEIDGKRINFGVSISAFGPAIRKALAAR
ncbi:MAG: trypsin-like peptidase domain-containing protein [Deltaproteobacteria bacterium]|nr:trypsin-like peptidase domain-containing protein [Deltaproteobacteria bacterium]